MRKLARLGLVVILIAFGVGGAIRFLSRPSSDSPNSRIGKSSIKQRGGAPIGRPALASPPPPPLFGSGFVDDSGYDLAFRYTAPIQDRSSLEQCYAANEGRSRRGLVDVEANLGRLDPNAPDFLARRHRLRLLTAILYMYDAEFEKAIAALETSLKEAPELPAPLRANTIALMGVCSLRRGEIDNCVGCVGPSSCILPISPEGRHLRRDGSRAAIARFTDYLRERPEDLGVRWLLNVAEMTVGGYPDNVPTEWRISFDPPNGSPAGKVGRFENVAATVGFESRGANMFGGSLFDDFTGDGLPDVFVSSNDWDRGASLFVNQGDGTFVDRGDEFGLSNQRMSQNLAHSDFDNDGDLDVLMLRGAWEAPYRMSLLRNDGAGRFEDVSVAAGLAEPIASQAAAWGDYDGDGDLDLYVAGEFLPRTRDPLNRCRLYQNLGDGTFRNVAEAAGVLNERWAKGAAWGDYDDDGRIDLYVSNMNDLNRLYHNNGDGTFKDVALELNVAEPVGSFACWFWDYDDDGRLDIFVTGFRAWLQDVAASHLGLPTEGERPKLYRNTGKAGFKDVTAEVGLDRVWLPMGCNFADFDNDGYLDVYLGTGKPPYSHLTPNVLLRNVQGKRFEDVTIASGTGHLQKGHGVSFADFDRDGDLDMFIQTGGTTPGDRAHNALFKNPGVNIGKSVRLRLVGSKSNRSAIGTKVVAEIKSPDGRTRLMRRDVSGGSSFGGNALEATLGLGEAAAIDRLVVTWAGSARQTVVTDLKAGEAREIREDAP